jgi:hypothetical protein
MRVGGAHLYTALLQMRIHEKMSLQSLIEISPRMADAQRML